VSHYIIYTFREIRENDLSSCASEIERLKLDFDKYLRENQDSEIIGELNRIDAVVQDFITDIEVQNSTLHCGF
jgi:hypothetical protein